ncbi:hypothetical protein E8E14_004872 [Neopestalotiopsis sp. 37M]|nr:hypothetical protein E8E14_004872 [Neopestalotiopsis sp. 37M]
MVMIDGIPGLEAWVCVNDERALEYEPSTGPPKVEEVDPPTSTKYIQSISGAAFSIHCKIGPDFNWSNARKSQYVDLRFHYKIDGKDQSYHTIEMHRSASVSRSTYPSPNRRGKFIFKKFRFATVKTIESNDNERIEKEKEFASQLGAVEIIVKRLVRKKQYFSGQAVAGEESSSESETDESETGDQPQTFEITQKALQGRAISNVASSGPAQGVSVLDSNGHSSDKPKRRTWEWADAKEDERPFAIFRFLYRSMDDLQKELIVPRNAALSIKEEERGGEASIDLPKELAIPPNPAPSVKQEETGEEASFENLAMEEIMQLARERFNQKRTDVKVKTEEKPIKKRPHDEIIDVEEKDSIRGSRNSRQKVFIDTNGVTMLRSSSSLSETG